MSDEQARKDAGREARDAGRAARRAARDAAREAREAARDARRARGQSRGDATRTEATIDAGVRRVTIDHTAGRLTIRQCAPGETPRVESVGSKAAPNLRVEQSGDHASIAIKLSLGRLFRRRQGADTEVWLPAELDELTIDQGAGRVDIEAVEAGELRLDVGAGDVNMRGSTAHLVVQVGAGKASITGHTGRANIDTGTGDVLLELAEAPPGTYAINTGMGAAEVQLPPGVEVDARISSGIGQARTDYPVAGPGAPVHIRMSTGIGKAVLTSATPGKKAARATERTTETRRGPRTAARRGEAEEMRVLQLMEQGRITPREAADLIAALKGMPPPYEEGDEDQ